MSLEITPEIHSILDAATEMTQVISAEAKEVPEHLYQQIGSGDYVYFDFLITLENEDVAEVAFVIPVQLLKEPTAVEDMQMGITQLVSCGCTRSGTNGDDVFCVDNPFFNRGKTTYLIRYPDMYQVKLEDTQPNLVAVQTENLTKLVQKLKDLDKVRGIRVEWIINEQLNSLADGERPVLIRAYIDINSDLKVDHSVSFVVPASVYDIETSHQWAIDNLTNLIELNNA